MLTVQAGGTENQYVELQQLDPEDPMEKKLQSGAILEPAAKHRHMLPTGNTLSG